MSLPIILMSYDFPNMFSRRCTKQPTSLTFSFLKVSVDQFSQNRYIPIRNPQGGGVDTSSFSGKKPGLRRILSLNIGKGMERGDVSGEECMCRK
jgi:hypothetical protein